MANFFASWISLEPLNMAGGAGRIMAALFALLFLLGLALRAYRTRRSKGDNHEKEIYRRMIRALTTMGALGMILAFLSFEGIRFLGARFWYPVWLAGAAVWAFFIIVYIKRQVPLMRARAIERVEKLKYMPGPKRK